MISLLLIALLSQNTNSSVCVQSGGANKGCVPYLNFTGATSATVSGKVATVTASGSGITTPHVHATQTISQNFTNGVLTRVIFNNVMWDTNGNYDPTTGVFTCTVPGYYRVSTGLMLDLTNAGGANVTLSLIIRRNATSDYHGEARLGVTVPVGIQYDYEALNVSNVVYLAAGNTLDVMEYQSNSGAVYFVPYNANGGAYLDIQRVR